MRRGAARLPALVLALAATSAGPIALAPTAHAAQCAQTNGVTVVVDSGRAGGISMGCAAGDPATGLDALKRSGHTYTFLPRQPGFVCTIDAKPDPCNDAPASAYWSYWHAQPGGSWSYSTTGAGSFNPKPGGVDGWSLGSGEPPSSRPPAATTSASASPGTATALGGQTSAATGNLTPDGGGGGVGGLALGVALVVLLGGIAGHLSRRRGDRTGADEGAR